MDGDRAKRRLRSVEIDEASLAPASREVEQERQVLLKQLQARCQQRHFRDMLFTLRFEAQ